MRFLLIVFCGLIFSACVSVNDTERAMYIAEIERLSGETTKGNIGLRVRDEQIQRLRQALEQAEKRKKVEAVK